MRGRVRFDFGGGPHKADHIPGRNRVVFCNGRVGRKICIRCDVAVCSLHGDAYPHEGILRNGENGAVGSGADLGSQSGGNVDAVVSAPVGGGGIIDQGIHAESGHHFPLQRLHGDGGSHGLYVNFRNFHDLRLHNGGGDFRSHGRVFGNILRNIFADHRVGYGKGQIFRREFLFLKENGIAHGAYCQNGNGRGYV